jgi:hypothetical protein
MYLQTKQGRTHLVKQTHYDVEILRTTKKALSKLEKEPCPVTMQTASKELRKLYCLLSNSTEGECEAVLIRT